MSLLLSLKDDQYPYFGFQETRVVCRAILLNDENKIALHYLERNDSFGVGNYYETPGGGLEKGESLEEAAIRECLEETGYCSISLGEIAQVNDAYNLIKRKNENHYFLLKTTAHQQKHFVSKGDLLIKQTVFVTIDEAIALLENEAKTPISKLVFAREYPILVFLRDNWSLLLRNNLPL